jgi:aldehyde dehydrogenase family protein
MPASAAPMFLGGIWSESDHPIEIWTPGGGVRPRRRPVQGGVLRRRARRHQRFRVRPASGRVHRRPRELMARVREPSGRRGHPQRLAGLPDHMPYGGVKDSGLGREGIHYAIEEMTESRLLVVAQPQ